MADEQENENGAGTTSEAPKPSGGGKGILQWLIMGVVVLVLAGLGFTAGRLLGRAPQTAQMPDESASQQSQQPDLVTKSLKAGVKGWYYDLEAVATNLSDAGSTRYIRAALTLEMLPEADQGKTRAFLDGKKPIMTNLLNIYFAGLSTDDINSDKDMRRIQVELTDIFNEKIFPDAKPLIRQILFREFGIQ